MFFQIETASTRSDPEDYINEKWLLFDEYDKWRHLDRKDSEMRETAVLLRRGSIDEVYGAIDHDTVIITTPSDRDHPKADLIVRVYDGYNE
jgi:hypothetical protein